MMWSERYETEAVLVTALWAGSKTVALGGVRGYISRQVRGVITLALKARRKANTHRGGEASAPLTAFPYDLGRVQLKARAELGGARLRSRAAAAPSCSQSCGTVPGVPGLSTATTRDRCPALPHRVHPPGKAAGSRQNSSICLEIQINRIMSAEQAPGHPHSKSPVRRKCTEGPFGRVGNSMLVSHIPSQHCNH